MKKCIGNGRGQVKASRRRCHSSKIQCKLQNDPRRYQGGEHSNRLISKCKNLKEEGSWYILEHKEASETGEK